MTGRLEGRLVGLGVTGSIAAYKAVELLRLLQAEGADVAVMLTPAATRFVGPLSFAALSRHPVETELLDLTSDGRIGHIVVGDSADVIVVAIGQAHFLKAEMVRSGSVVVDVGMNRLPDGKLVGDVHFESVAKLASAITPVPGGVGPMTITMLLFNTLAAAKSQAG